MKKIGRKTLINDDKYLIDRFILSCNYRSCELWFLCDDPSRIKGFISEIIMFILIKFHNPLIIWHTRFYHAAFKRV